MVSPPVPREPQRTEPVREDIRGDENAADGLFGWLFKKTPKKW